MKGEPGVYITAEEREEDIKGDIKAMFGWDFDSLENSNLIKFITIKPSLPGKVITGEELARLVKLYVFDLGQKIDTLINKPMPVGYYEIEFNAQNLPSGVYYYRIEVGEFQDVKKMILIK